MVAKYVAKYIAKYVAGFQAAGTNPIRLRGDSGGSIRLRMAANTAWNRSSQRSSIASILRRNTPRIVSFDRRILPSGSFSPHEPRSGAYARGLRHFKPLNLPKSVSVGHSSTPCSMARAARCASDVRLPPLPSGRSGLRRTVRWRGPGCTIVVLGCSIQESSRSRERRRFRGWTV